MSWEFGPHEVREKVWLVSLLQYDQGLFDHESGRVTATDNPFARVDSGSPHDFRPRNARMPTCPREDP